MKRYTIDFINDLVEAIDDLEKFIKGFDYATFQKDKKTVYSVVRAIEIMGEAAKNIPDSMRGEYPQIPWRQIAGMRDKLSHAYFGVDMMTLWKAATQEAPSLKPFLLEIVENEEKNESGNQ